MNKTFVTFALVCLYAPVAVMACSTSGSSGGSGAVSTIDPSKQANTLSDAEKTQYCKDATAYLSRQITADDTKKSSCLVKAINSIVQGGTPPKTDADYQSKCKAAYQECMSKPAPTADAGATKDECATAAKDLANCTATIGEVNQCISDTSASLKASLAKFDTTCDTIQLDGGGVDRSQPTQPASCKAIETKCPAFGSNAVTDR